MTAIDKTRLPAHVAIIMDGNGRWAKKQGFMRVMGHRNAIQAVRQTVERAAETGIPYLTLFAFSTENWRRPKMEVEALMHLLLTTLESELKTLTENNIRLNVIGEYTALPVGCVRALEQTIEKTQYHTRMTLTLALNYGGRADILHAVKKVGQLASQRPEMLTALTESEFGKYLGTADMPELELLIRTSGEYRISNFLLWELAYAEIHFTPKLWPDFTKADFDLAILDFQQRERRFGKTGEQVEYYSSKTSESKESHE